MTTSTFTNPDLGEENTDKKIFKTDLGVGRTDKKMSVLMESRTKRLAMSKKRLETFVPKDTFKKLPSSVSPASLFKDTSKRPKPLVPQANVELFGSRVQEAAQLRKQPILLDWEHQCATPAPTYSIMDFVVPSRRKGPKVAYAQGGIKDEDPPKKASTPPASPESSDSESNLVFDDTYHDWLDSSLNATDYLNAEDSFNPASEGLMYSDPTESPNASDSDEALPASKGKRKVPVPQNSESESAPTEESEKSNFLREFMSDVRGKLPDEDTFSYLRNGANNIVDKVKKSTTEAIGKAKEVFSDVGKREEVEDVATDEETSESLEDSESGHETHEIPWHERLRQKASGVFSRMKKDEESDLAKESSGPTPWTKFRAWTSSFFHDHESTHNVEGWRAKFVARLSSVGLEKTFGALLIRNVLLTLFMAGGGSLLYLIMTLFSLMPYYHLILMGSVSIGGWIGAKVLLTQTFAKYLFAHIHTMVPFPSALDNITAVAQTVLATSFLDIADFTTLIWHGVDCFKSKAARFSYVVHVAVRLAKSVDVSLSESISNIWKDTPEADKAKAQVFNSDTVAEFFSKVFLTTPGTKNYVRDFNDRAMAVRNFGSLVSLAKEFYSWFVSTNSGRQEYEDWMSDASQIIIDNPKEFDEECKYTLREIYNRGVTLREKMALASPELKKVIPSAFLSTLADFNRYFDNARTKINDWGPRIKPVTILMMGTAGTGKSELAGILTQIAALSLEHPTVSWDSIKHKVYTYSRNANARCDGITAEHTVFVMDDFLQVRETTEKAAEAILFCRVASKDPYFPDVAAMSEKRTAVARPHFVFVTSNQDINDTSPMGIEDSHAVTRRCDFIVSLPPITTPQDNPSIRSFTRCKLMQHPGGAPLVVSGPQLAARMLDLHNQRAQAFEQSSEVAVESETFLATYRSRAQNLSEFIGVAVDASISLFFIAIISMINPIGLVPYAFLIVGNAFLSRGSNQKNAVIAGVTVILLIISFLAFFVRYNKAKEKDDEEDGEELDDERLAKPDPEKYFPEDEVGDAQYIAKPRRPNRRKAKISRAQVDTDPQARAIIQSCKPNMGVATLRSGYRAAQVKCVFVHGSYILVNRHLFLMAKGHRPTLTIWRPNSEVTFPVSEFERTDVADDFVLIHHKSIPPARSILKHFIREVDLPTRTGYVRNPFLLVNNERSDAVYTFNATRVPYANYRTSRLIQVVDGEMTDIVLNGFYEFIAETNNGDCGSLYFALDNNCENKIIAVHAAATTAAVAIGKPVTYEALKAAIKYETGLDSDEKSFAQSGVRFVDNQKSWRVSDKIPLGFWYVGFAQDAAYMPSKSKYVPSPLQEDVQPTTNVPHMEPWEKDGRIIIPEEYFFSKGALPADVDRDIVMRALEGEEYVVPPPDHHFSSSVLSERAMLNGEPGTMCHSVRLDSSAGYRLRAMCTGSGKMPYLQKDAEGEIVLSDFAREDLDAYQRVLETQETFAVFADVQKDERYPFAKEDKYRIVSTDDVRDFLLFRKFFGVFLEALRRFHPHGNSQVGIDATGPEFHFLYTFMKALNDKVFELDAKAWDFFIAYLIRDGFFIVAERWYTLHFGCDEYASVRAHLSSRYLNHAHIFRNIVVFRHGGMCSGGAGTAEENGFAGRIVTKICYQSTVREDRFDDFVRTAHYGDDILVAVSEHIEDVFNQVTFAKASKELLGLKWTTSQKTEVLLPFEPLKGASFVSRTFAKIDDSVDFIVGRLDEDKVKEIALWIRTNDPAEKAAFFFQNCEASLREMFFHGEKRFQEWKSLINARLAKEGIPPTELTYDGLMVELLAKF